MNHRDFLESAKRLLRDADSDPDEKCARAIIHAAYYAVFHLCAGELGINPEEKGKGHHTVVADRVQQDKSNNKILSAARTELMSLRVARVDADYFLNKPLGKTDAILAVMRANRIFKFALPPAQDISPEPVA